jgi:hypothetical protein
LLKRGHMFYNKKMNIGKKNKISVKYNYAQANDSGRGGCRMRLSLDSPLERNEHCIISFCVSREVQKLR